MSDTITITGNVATEPESKRTSGGVSITTFRLASAQRRFDRPTGVWVDSGTNWYSVSAFRGLADHAFASLRKGQPVVLTGRLRIKDWDNGTKRGTDVEIDAEAIGHDLRWGTSTFSKDAPAATAGSDAWSSDADAPEWRAPGADGEAGPSAPEPGSEGEARPLVLAGVDAPF